MTALTNEQREILQMYALGDKAADIARDLSLSRVTVVNELSRLCHLDRARASELLADHVDLATLTECTCDADIELPHAPHLPEHVAAIAAADVGAPGMTLPHPPDPVSLDQFLTAPAVQPWDNEPPIRTEHKPPAPPKPKLAAGGIIDRPRIEPTYIDYRAYRCTDCGRIGPGACQPGHASVPVTIRVFDAEVR